MGKAEDINARNIIIALGGACYQHKYVNTSAPDIKECSECGMRILKVAPKKPNKEGKSAPQKS